MPIATARSGPIAARGSCDHDLPALLTDRDLGLLRFQQRVFEEARDPKTPLLERVKFIAIIGTNIDDFLAVRAPRIARRPAKRFVVEAVVRRLLAQSYAYWRRRLVPALTSAGIHLVDYAELTSGERDQIDRHFSDAIRPLLTHVEWRPGSPLPNLSTFGTNFVVARADGHDDAGLALVAVPDAVSPLLSFDRRSQRGGVGPASERGYVWLDQVLRASLERQSRVSSVHAFRVLREEGLTLEGIEGPRPADRVIEAARRRGGNRVAAFIAERTTPSRVIDQLAAGLEAPSSAIHLSGAVFELRRLWAVTHLHRPDLHEPEFTPRNARRTRGDDIFQTIRAGDVLLHHPFDSFQPVVDLLAAAADDPTVTSISITLYRTDRESPVVHRLIEAARQGKRVRVLIELAARLDEERNARWALRLADAGAQVFHAPPGLKVHAKMAVIVRHEGSRRRSYVHISSGNYNAFTSRVYTDLGLLTCSEEIAADAHALFDALAGSGPPTGSRCLLVAPIALRAAFEALVDREVSHQGSAHPGHIVLKMNALVDPGVIGRLSHASQAGVVVDLLVRGPCCLRPGVPGLSERIRVRSIVGRFLEHSRVWYFHNGGDEKVYIGSADLMPRNLDRRVEVMVPITDPRLVRRVRDDILGLYWADSVKARELRADGSYARVPGVPGQRAIDCQLALLAEGDACADHHLA